MPANTLSEELLNYFTRLPEQDQREVVAIVKRYAEEEEPERPQTLEEYNRELEEADAEIEAGNFVTHEEVVKHFLNRRRG